MEINSFDVFLCHRSEDKPEIRRIADALRQEGIRVWLDEEEIQPGKLWQKVLETQLENIKAAAIFFGKSGVGPWQDFEIQILLNEFAIRKCPIIPVVLSSAIEDPDWPICLKCFQIVDFRKSDTNPLKKLIWGITGEKQKSQLEILPDTDQRCEADSPDQKMYLPMADLPNEDQRNQLIILRDKEKSWVIDLFDKSLNGEGLIYLGKTSRDDAIQTPWNLIYKLPIQRKQLSPDDMSISQFFDAAGRLLILGEPGSGKTTTLLELSKDLIKRAEANQKDRIPIVLNLSSWTKKQTLEEWIELELKEKHKVPKKLIQIWLDKCFLVPLLDGLDEVSPELQADCVVAINEFIDTRELPGIVVCCRLMEYQWLPKRLKLSGAICLEPLDSEQIDDHFANSGPQLEALRIAIKEDPILLELAKSPLMLSVMNVTYRSASVESLAGANTLEERRKQIFSAYVENTFQREDKQDQIFSKEKIKYSLSWLARGMTEHSRSIFFVEELQPSWILNHALLWIYVLGSRLFIGLFLGLGFWLFYGQVFNLDPIMAEEWPSLDLYAALLVGLNSGLVIGIIDLIRFNRKSVLPERNNALFSLLTIFLNVVVVGLFLTVTVWLSYRLSVGPGKDSYPMFVGLIGGVVGGLIFGPRGRHQRITRDIQTVEALGWSLRKSIKLAPCGLIAGPFIGFIFLLVVGPTGALQYGLLGTALSLVVAVLFGGLYPKFIEEKATPNEGIKLSLRNAIFTGLLFGLVFGFSHILFIVIGQILFSLSDFHPVVSLSYGLIIMLLAGLWYGGLDVIQHYILRFILWCDGGLPMKCTPLLEYCSRLILLKKGGGGYQFFHRMFLEYFADLNTSDKLTLRKKK